MYIFFSENMRITTRFTLSWASRSLFTLLFHQVLDGLSTNVFQQVQDRQYAFILPSLSDVPPMATHTQVVVHLKDVVENSTLGSKITMLLLSAPHCRARNVRLAPSEWGAHALREMKMDRASENRAKYQNVKVNVFWESRVDEVDLWFKVDLKCPEEINFQLHLSYSFALA